MQYRFNQRTPARAEKLLALPKFRAAFDLLDLRCHADPSLIEMRDWWLHFQTADDSARQQLLDGVPRADQPSISKRRPRRNTKTRRKPARKDVE
jgi:poly(A) polymerase